MAIDLIADDECIPLDLENVRFWGRRITAKEQREGERKFTKKGELDAHGLMASFLDSHITGWEPNPDPVRLDGREVGYSRENLQRLPLGIRNELIGKLYEESPDPVGNSSAGSDPYTPHED